MSFKKNALATVALSAVAVAVSSAYAAGFQLSEQSAAGQGRAMAGAGIVGDDLSALHFNAAGMTLLPGTRIQIGGTWIEVNAEFKGENGFDNENGRLKGQLIPHGYISHQVNDQTWVGLAMTVPYGMGTEYDQNWDGADKGTESMIMTVDINPQVAYKVNDFFSIGAGVSLQYAKAELGLEKNGVSHAWVKGDSWALGWNLGLMFQPTETLRFGVAYRSNICHDAEGETKFELNQTGSTQHAGLQQLVPSAQQNMMSPNWTAPNGMSAMEVLTSYATLSAMNGSVVDMDVRIRTPDTLTFSGTWEATDDLRLSATARWSKWSNFGKLNVENQKLGQTVTSTTHNDWDDTWFFSFGADYRLNHQWTVRGGVAYDMDPNSDDKKRMAVIPDTDRVWLSMGASYKYDNNLTFDFGGTYIMGVGNTDLYSEAGQKYGEYDSLNSFIFAASMQYRF